ncbi:MAG: metallophosphoesterase [Actinomycetota bacterium]
MDITTVADDLIVLHEGTSAHRVDGLPAGTEQVVSAFGTDVAVTTLGRPAGALRSRVATVNDVHFGETEAGRVDDHPEGPIRRAAPGDEPYPEVMNGAAADEIAALDPDAVVVKGDLSVDGRPEEWAAFERCYRQPFGDRLHVVRGNHDSYHHQDRYAGDVWIELAGLNIALLDTAIPGATTGTIRTEQLDWLDAQAEGSTDPVIVMGHHQQWIGQDSGKRSDDYFGLHPDPSDALDELAARRSAVIAYTAGHTHRHRVRTMRRSGIPTVEIGCTKDFPGTWAEYRVFDGGVMQVVHRMSSPEALAWSESCRTLYADFGVDYASYALGTLAERCFTIPLR